MPKRCRPLSEDQVKTAAAADKSYKLFDGDRLHLLVSPTRKGTVGKYWRFSYRFDGKQKLLALGTYPEVTLDDARKLRNDAAQLLAEGIDPCAARKSGKAAEKAIGQAAEATCNRLPSVKFIMSGGVEIWKGRAVVRLTDDEALFVRGLLQLFSPPAR